MNSCSVTLTDEFLLCHPDRHCLAAADHSTSHARRLLVHLSTHARRSRHLTIDNGAELARRAPPRRHALVPKITGSSNRRRGHQKRSSSGMGVPSRPPTMCPMRRLSAQEAQTSISSLSGDWSPPAEVTQTVSVDLEASNQDIALCLTLLRTASGARGGLTFGAPKPGRVGPLQRGRISESEPLSLHGNRRAKARRKRRRTKVRQEAAQAKACSDAPLRLSEKPLIARSAGASY